MCIQVHCAVLILFLFLFLFLPLAPHPSEQIQKLIGRLCLDDDKLTNEFLNGMLNQLNWAFSEFIGMLQEVRLVTTVISVYFGRAASSSLFILRNTRAHTLHKHDSHSTYRNSFMNTRAHNMYNTNTSTYTHAHTHTHARTVTKTLSVQIFIYDDHGCNIGWTR